MALNINTNIGALGAAAAATSVNKSMESAMERLSTGLRINTAADDAAGVAIASRLTSEIRGTNQAIRNAMDGQAMIDTAEGAHNEIVNILQRMRELSVQAANDTNDANDRGNLQLEIDQLTTEINRIADVTTWAGQKLLNGTGGTASNGVFTFQVGNGVAAENQIAATINSMTAAALGVGEGSVAASADAATMTEVGNNALQISGSPEAGDVFNLTVGGTELAVKLITVADDPVVLAPSGIQTNGTDISVSGATLSVDANGAGDFFNINVNGTDVQVTSGANAAATATAIKTAIDAVSDLGVSITDNTDGTLTFAPTTTYQVSTDGGTTYGSTAFFAANGVEGAAGAIAAAINAQNPVATATSTLVGITATAGADGSVSLTQAVNFSAAGVDAGATATLATTTFDLTKAFSATGLTNFTLAANASGDIDDLAAALAATDEIKSATVDGTDIDIVFENGVGHEFSLTDAATTPATVSIATANITGGASDTSKASTSADGTVLTLTPTGYEAGDEVNFTINGEAFAVAVSATDKYDANQAGLIQKIQDQLDASTKQGGMTFTVAASAVVGETDNIIITATAATTDLIEDVSTDPASASAASTGLNVATAADALASITAIDAAISTVNTQRANLGAVSNRLDSTVSNLTNISTNLEAGRSRIQDADFAAESTSLAKSQILQQASMAMLAQANASKQGVLSLLQG
jgi:flagellin